MRLRNQFEFVPAFKSDNEHNWKESAHFAAMLAKYWQRLSRIINGEISFGDGVSPDNIAGVFSDVTTPVTPNTNFVVTHNLGRLPVGYIVIGKTAAVDVYDGSVADTNTTLSLRASVASIGIRLFIITLILCILPLKAQNVRRDDVALQVITQNTAAGTLTYVTPISGAVITVCSATATGIPCSPTVPVCSSSSDVTCNQPNPISADSNGNYGFWIAPGRYQVSITSNNVQGKLITYDLPVGQDDSNNTTSKAYAASSYTASTQITTPIINMTGGGSMSGIPNGATGFSVVEVTNGAFDKLAQTSNVGATIIATPTASGAVRVCASLVVTTAATTSSTLPAAQAVWTDADSGTVLTKSFTSTDVGNALTTNQGGCLPINPKLNTTVSYQTTSYASSGATSMAYSIHVRLENH